MFPWWYFKNSKYNFYKLSTHFVAPFFMLLPINTLSRSRSMATWIVSKTTTSKKGENFTWKGTPTLKFLVSHKKWLEVQHVLGKDLLKLQQKPPIFLCIQINKVFGNKMGNNQIWCFKVHKEFWNCPSSPKVRCKPQEHLAKGFKTLQGEASKKHRALLSYIVGGFW